MDVSVNDVVARYIALRQEKERVEKEYKEKLEIISDWLRRHMDQQGVKSLKVENGTVTAAIKRTPKITDIDAFEVFADNNPDAWKRSLNTTFVLERLDAGDEPPPGVTVDSTYYVSVRSN